MPNTSHAGHKRASQRADHDMEERVAAVFARYREVVGAGLKTTIETARENSDEDAQTLAAIELFYGQMAYHFGWRRADLREASANPGKLLRPTLVLLGYELARGARGAQAILTADSLAPALPAAIAVEIVHNFSLIHDDIEDHDEERRHRPTLWRVWGQPQAINTGDGMFALARLTLLKVLEYGVSPALVVELAAMLDRTCLRLCEGQHLDMIFEGRHDITPTMYLAMIERKTAALMACALEIGARLGGADVALAGQLSAFGRALGLAFQLRDDILGIWADFAHLGKVEAGDLRRKKMSLPIIYALDLATPPDRQLLLDLFESSAAASDDQIMAVLAALERSGARARVQAVLAEQCATARALLGVVGGTPSATKEPRDCLSTLVDFVARTDP